MPLPLWMSAAALSSCVVASSVAIVSSEAGVGVIVLTCALLVGYSDVVWRRIPNIMCAALIVFAVVAVALDGSGWASMAVGAGMTAAPFLILHLVDPRWVGFGDVKLLFALGAVLGVLSPVAGLAAMWLAGLLVLVTRPWVPLGWRQSVPFGFWVSTSAVVVAVAVVVA